MPNGEHLTPLPTPRVNGAIKPAFWLAGLAGTVIAGLVGSFLNQIRADHDELTVLKTEVRAIVVSLRGIEAKLDRALNPERSK